MDRWLEEYFAELETVFGLGLFERRRRDGGLEEAPGGADSETPKENSALGERRLDPERLDGQIWAPRDENAGFPDLPGEMLMAEESFFRAMEGYSAAAETDLESERISVQADLRPSSPTWAGRFEDEPEWKKKDGALEEEPILAEDGLPFTAVLPPVLRMEANRREIAGQAGEWEEAMLWKDTVPVGKQTEMESESESRFSLPFAQGTGEEKDEIFDELLDELERRLMLEIGGAAEGRY